MYLTSPFLARSSHSVSPVIKEIELTVLMPCLNEAETIGIYSFANEANPNLLIGAQLAGIDRAIFASHVTRHPLAGRTNNIIVAVRRRATRQLST
jgi:hypothetical protein